MLRIQGVFACMDLCKDALAAPFAVVPSFSAASCVWPLRLLCEPLEPPPTTQQNVEEMGLLEHCVTG